MQRAKRGPSEGNSNLPDHREYWNRGLWLRKKVGNAIGVEQRRSKRYPVKLDLSYTVSFGGKVLDCGEGRVVDWSSSGLRFECERPVGIGRTLELSIRWPLALDNGVPLKVVVSGRAVRVGARETAVKIIRHEFRTYKSSDEQRPIDAPPQSRWVYGPAERAFPFRRDFAAVGPVTHPRPARSIHYRD